MSKTIALLTTEYPPYPGGIATYTWCIAEALAQAGNTPVIYAIGDETPSAPPPGVSVVHIPEPTYSHLRQPFVIAKAVRALRERAFDVVFACDYRLILALGWWRGRGEKVAGVHGTDVKSRILTLLGDTHLYRALAGFKRIVANSAFTKAELLAHHPYIPPSAVAVAPLGVAAFWRESLATERRDALLAPLDLPSDASVFVSIGRIERRKGQLAAIKAIASLPDEDRRKVTYVIVGREVEADYAAELRQAIAASDADVRMAGVLDIEVLRALCHRGTALLHAATLVPRKAEGFGLVIAEAAACGLPTIATRVDAIPEVARDGVNAILVDDGDVEDLAAAIRRLVHDPELQASLAQGALQVARECNWSVAASAVSGDVAAA